MSYRKPAPPHLQFKPPPPCDDGRARAVILDHQGFTKPPAPPQSEYSEQAEYSEQDYDDDDSYLDDDEEEEEQEQEEEEEEESASASTIAALASHTKALSQRVRVQEEMLERCSAERSQFDLTKRELDRTKREARALDTAARELREERSGEATSAKAERERFTRERAKLQAALSRVESERDSARRSLAESVTERKAAERRLKLEAENRMRSLRLDCARSKKQLEELEPKIQAENEAKLLAAKSDALEMRNACFAAKKQAAAAAGRFEASRDDLRAAREAENRFQAERFRSAELREALEAAQRKAARLVESHEQTRSTLVSLLNDGESALLETRLRRLVAEMDQHGAPSGARVLSKPERKRSPSPQRRPAPETATRRSPPAKARPARSAPKPPPSMPPDKRPSLDVGIMKRYSQHRVTLDDALPPDVLAAMNEPLKWSS